MYSSLSVVTVSSPHKSFHFVQLHYKNNTKAAYALKRYGRRIILVKQENRVHYIYLVWATIMQNNISILNNDKNVLKLKLFVNHEYGKWKKHKNMNTP